MNIYTDGPWEVIKHSDECGAVRVGDIIVEGAYRGGESDTLSLADAHLISASPELARAAQLALHCLVQSGVSKYHPEVDAALRGALAKANIEIHGWEPAATGKAWGDYPVGTKARVRGDPGYYTRRENGWAWLEQQTRHNAAEPYNCNEIKLPQED